MTDLPPIPTDPAEALPPPAPPVEDVRKALTALVARLGLQVGPPDALSSARRLPVSTADLMQLRAALAPATVAAGRAARRTARPRSTGAAIESAPATAAMTSKDPALAGATVTVSARLVLQGIDARLGNDEARVVPDTSGLGFSVLAAPRFVEPGTPAAEATRRLSLHARVTASASVAGEDHASDEVLVPAEPLTLELEPAALPTVLALFRHREYAPASAGAPGFVLALVPPGSDVGERAERLGELLEGALGVPVATLTSRLSLLPALAPSMARLTALTKAVARQAFRVRHAPQRDLNRVEMIDAGGIRNDTEADNQVSSLMLLGRPGTVADLYCATGLRPRRGHLRLTLERSSPVPLSLLALPKLPEQPAARLPARVPAARRPEGTVSVEIPATEDVAGTREVFADAISSVELATLEQA